MVDSFMALITFSHFSALWGCCPGHSPRSVTAFLTAHYLDHVCLINQTLEDISLVHFPPPHLKWYLQHLTHQTDLGDQQWRAGDHVVTSKISHTTKTTCKVLQEKMWGLLWCYLTSGKQDTHTQVST